MNEELLQKFMKEAAMLERSASAFSVEACSGSERSIEKSHLLRATYSETILEADNVVCAGGVEYRTADQDYAMLKTIIDAGGMKMEDLNSRFGEEAQASIIALLDVDLIEIVAGDP